MEPSPRNGGLQSTAHLPRMCEFEPPICHREEFQKKPEQPELMNQGSQNDKREIGLNNGNSASVARHHRTERGEDLGHLPLALAFLADEDVTVPATQPARRPHHPPAGRRSRRALGRTNLTPCTSRGPCPPTTTGAPVTAGRTLRCIDRGLHGAGLTCDQQRPVLFTSRTGPGGRSWVSDAPVRLLGESPRVGAGKHVGFWARSRCFPRTGRHRPNPGQARSRRAILPRSSRKGLLLWH